MRLTNSCFSRHPRHSSPHEAKIFLSSSTRIFFRSSLLRSLNSGPGEVEEDDDVLIAYPPHIDGTFLRTMFEFAYLRVSAAEAPAYLLRRNVGGQRLRDGSCDTGGCVVAGAEVVTLSRDRGRYHHACS